MTSIKDVSEIRAYQHALTLYPDVIYLVSLIPESYRKQRDQLLNSSVAIAPLIAEGFAKKRNNAEIKRFFEMAMAESDELITHLRIVKSLAPLCRRVEPTRCDHLIEGYKTVSKELNNLIKNWNKFSY